MSTRICKPIAIAMLAFVVAVACSGHRPTPIIPASGPVTPPDPPTDGAVVAGVNFVPGDGKGPIDHQHGHNRTDALLGSAGYNWVGFTLPSPVLASRLTIEVEGPLGSEVRISGSAIYVYGRFGRNHDRLVAACPNCRGNPYEPSGSPSPSMYFDSGSAGAYPIGVQSPYRLSERRFRHRFTAISQLAPNHVELTQRQAWDQLVLLEEISPGVDRDYPLGEVSIHGLALALLGYPTDVRDAPGQGIRVTIKVNGTVVAHQTVWAAWHETALLRGMVQAASVQGIGVHIPNGEVLHELNLFAGQGPGLSIDMSLGYSSYFSGYWRAVASRTRRQGTNDADWKEFVYIPFGHGWSGPYTLCMLRETYEEWVSPFNPFNQSKVIREGPWTLQTAHGRKYVFRERLSQPGSFDLNVREMSPTFGVPFDELVLEQTASGGYTLGSPLSRIEATFDGQGRLTSLRRRDHGRPLTLEYLTDRVLITDSQGRITRWMLRSDGLVSEIHDPSTPSRVWELDYGGGHSLLSVKQRGAGPEYIFDYQNNHQLGGVTGPDGTYTEITYRPNGIDPTPASSRVPAYTVDRIAEGNIGSSWRTFDYERRAGDAFLVTVRDALGRTVTYDSTRPRHWLTTAAPFTSQQWFGVDGTLYQDTTPHSAPVSTTVFRHYPSVVDPMHGVITRYRDTTQVQLNLDPNGFWPTDATDEARNTTIYTPTTSANAVGLIGAITEPATTNPRVSGTVTAAAGPAKTTFLHNDDGEVTNVINAEGFETVLERHTANGKVGLVWKQERKDMAGGPSSVYEFDYDKMGNLTSMTAPFGAVTTYAYSNLDKVSTTTWPDSSITVHTYDTAGRLETIIGPAGEKQIFTYQPAGKLSLVEAVEVEGAGTTTYSYNALGEIDTITSPRGATQQYIYESNDRGMLELIIEQPSGRVTRFGRDSVGNVTEQRLQSQGLADQVVGFDYTILDQLETVTLPAQPDPRSTTGATWTPQTNYLYTSRRQVESVRRDYAPGSNPLQHVVSQRYDERMRPTHTRYGEAPFTTFTDITILDQVSNTRRFEVPQDPPVGSPVNRARQSVSSDVDYFGRTTTIRNTAGEIVEQVVLDPAGRVTEVWAPDSSGTLAKIQTRNYHPLKARLGTITDHYSQTSSGTTTLEYYPTTGLLWKTVDGLRNVTERIYDTHGRLREVQVNGVDGTNSKQGITYMPTGEVETRTQTFTVGGSVQTFATTYTYTSLEGRLQTITNPLGKITRFEYDSKGQLSKRTDANGRWSEYRYDDSGRVIRIEYYVPSATATPPLPHRTLTMTYDGMGRLATETDGQYFREYFRDHLGRMKEIATTLPTAPFSRSFRFEYVDDYGQLTALQDSEGFSTVYSHDTENRVSAIRRGPTVSAANAATPTATFAWDTSSRLKAWDSPGTGTIAREYNASGQILRQLGPLPGQEISYLYDNFGRKEHRTHSHLDLETIWKYDDLSQLTDEEMRVNGSPRYRDHFSYDDAGNRIQRVRNGVPQSFAYNGFNQLESTTTSELVQVSLPLAASADSTRGAGYELNLALDGAKPTTSGAGEAFVSDTGVGEHYLEIRSSPSAPMTVYSIKLFLPGDDNGLPNQLRIAFEDPPGTWNDVQILAIEGATQAAAGAPEFTPTANTVTAMFLGVNTEAMRIVQPAGTAAGAAHVGALALNEVELYSVLTSTTSYSYDDNGNMTGEDNRTYGYDEENRLSSVSEPGVADMSLFYGPGGKLLNETDNMSGTVTRHAYLGSEIYADYNAGGVLVRKYIHGPLLDQKVAVEDFVGGAAQPLKYMWPEPNGTIHQVTDPSGMPFETRVTSSWGEPLSMADLGFSPSGSAVTEFGYTGRRNLGDTGLMDYRARFYDPKLGRFLNPDPSGTMVGLNRYVYASGDSVNLTDPSGLQASGGRAQSGARTARRRARQDMMRELYRRTAQKIFSWKQARARFLRINVSRTSGGGSVRRQGQPMVEMLEWIDRNRPAIVEWIYQFRASQGRRPGFKELDTWVREQAMPTPPVLPSMNNTSEASRVDIRLVQEARFLRILLDRTRAEDLETTNVTVVRLRVTYSDARGKQKPASGPGSSDVRYVAEINDRSTTHSEWKIDRTINDLKQGKAVVQVIVEETYSEREPCFSFECNKVVRRWGDGNVFWTVPDAWVSRRGRGRSRRVFDARRILTEGYRFGEHDILPVDPGLRPATKYWMPAVE